MSSPVVQIIKTIEEITVEPGQTLTVWLNKSKTKRRSVQVELRVDESGHPEIYTKIDEVTIKDFKEYPELTI